MTVAFVFPGQGSQKRGMGRELFDETPEYLAVEQEVDAIVGYSMRQLCIEDPGNLVNDTRYTQPALYVVNALHFYRAIRSGQRPTFLAGHSLGEYSALFAAGAFDLIAGLRLVQERGRLMSQAQNGGMAAVIGPSAARVEQILTQNRLTTLDVANFNSTSQTVISGPREDIERASSRFEAAGVGLYVPLPVSAAFHSRYMEPAAREFAGILRCMTFRELQTPVIANATGRPYPGASSIAELLVKQISGSVQWAQTICYLLDHGVTQFTEIGPGNVLTRLVQEIRKAERPATESLVAGHH